MWSRGLLVVLLLLSPLGVSGCWDRIEMNDLAWVMATGIDEAEDGKIRMTLQIATPANGSSDSPKGKSDQFIVQSAVGKNLHDAQQKIENRMSRQLYEGHRRIILIGEDLAKRGIKNILDQYSRDPLSRLRSYILVAKDKRAQEMLQLKYPFEKAPAEAIREMALSNNGLGVTLRDFLISATSLDISPVMGVIEAEGGKNMHLAGTAIFQNFQLCGYLDEKETRQLLWLRGEMANRLFTSSIPNKGEVAIEMTALQQKLEAMPEESPIKFDVKLKVRAMVHENDTPFNLLSPPNIALIEQSIAKDMEGQIAKTIAQVQQKYKADVFGFGQELHRHHPRAWRAHRDRWEELFPTAEINVSVQIDLERTGLSGPPLQLDESEVL
ncbi:Ger(x)C family spore germination protein [Tumebacillus lipolyticus]|uniref:Ger(X)C family spore germination protein n=1 Tax=Tumebacillus lipolyticus TaxID=1280370 RepID=A0ABW5A026_9BACL